MEDYLLKIEYFAKNFVLRSKSEETKNLYLQETLSNPDFFFLLDEKYRVLVDNRINYYNLTDNNRIENYSTGKIVDIIKSNICVVSKCIF